jgi:hypothetical protein
MNHSGRARRVAALGFLIAAVTAAPSQAVVNVVADGPGNTYELLEGKGMGLELPDCGHNVRHIREIFDSTLDKNVFAFDIHAKIDDDRCNGSTDRQRLEIKTNSGSEMQHTSGQTAYYRWKFKIPTGFIPSGGFTHIHQIKAHAGGDEGSPLITITPRAGSPEQMQLIYTAGSGGSGSGTKTQAPLAPFKNTWVEAFETYKSSDSGTYSIVIKRLSDGLTLLSWSSTNIDMWRSGNDFNRGKWGIYRRLDPVLRDETVLFADWCVSESSANDCPSDVGNTNPTPTPTATATPTTPTATPTGTATPTATATATPIGGGTWEAQSLSPVASGATTAMQNDTGATGGTWLALLADGSGDFVQLTTPSVSAGTYSFSLRYKAHPSRGIVQANVNGVNVGAPLDQYAATAAFVNHTFGTVTLAAGSQVLRFTCVGKNPASSGFTISLDTITLTRLADATPTATATPTSTPTATPTSTPTMTATPTATSPSPTPTATPCTGCFAGYYRLTARHSSKVVAVQGASTSEGAAVVQATYGGAPTNDEWEIVGIGSGYYRVMNRNSAKALAVQGASTSSSVPLVQNTYGGAATNDEWQVNDLGTGYYSFINRNSGKAMDVKAGSTNDGAVLQQSTWSGVNQQQYQIVSVP